MQPDTGEIIFIDHNYAGSPVTHTQSTTVTNGSTHNEHNEIVEKLLLTFTKVHVCVNGPQAVDILRRRDFLNPEATLVLVSVDQPKVEVDETLLEAGIAGEPRGVVAQSIEGLRGIALLNHLNTECRRRKLPWIVTAAIISNPNSEVFCKLIDIGTTDCVELPLNGFKVHRLSAALYRKFRKRTLTKRLDLPDDADKYELENTIPTAYEWSALHTRVQTIYLQDLSNNQRMLDHHMPVPETTNIPDEAQFAQDEFSKQITRMRSLVSTWNFDALALSDEDLLMASFAMFKHVLAIDGNEDYRISDRKLYEFLICIKTLYHSSNAYHNFRHAVDVQQALFFFLLSSGAFRGMTDTSTTYKPISESCQVMSTLFSPDYMLAALIVGIGHDVGHPGVTNAFLISTKSPLATLYNDRSVLENLHCAALSRTLAKTWPAAQGTHMRKIIMELVLSTDMALHFDYMTRFQDMENLTMQRRSSGDKSPIPATMLEKCRITLFSALVKCADISNVARPFDISMDWSVALLREFFNQGRLEAALGLSVTPMLNPEKTIQANSQAFFIDMFALPLFRSLNTVLPTFRTIVDVLATNHATWQARQIKSNPESSVAPALPPSVPAKQEAPQVPVKESVTATSSRIATPNGTRKKPFEKLTGLFTKKSRADLNQS